MYHEQALGWVIVVPKGTEWMTATVNHEDPPHTLSMRMVFCDNEGYANALLQQMQTKFPAKYAEGKVVAVSIEMKEVSREEAEQWQVNDGRRFRSA